MKVTVKNKSAQKKWRAIVIATIIGMLAVLLTVVGLAIGESVAPTPQLSIVATNLSFSDSIYIKYAVSLENVTSEEDVKLLVWTKGNGEYTLGTDGAYVISADGTAKVADKECLIFNFTEIAAKEMTDYVYARAVYEKNGETYYSDVKKYSVLTYVYNKLGYTGTATQNEELAALLEGLIEYGASAQTYFNYKTGALATDRHVKITLEDGYFSDGCTTTLAAVGSKITVTAPSAVGNGAFMCWKDANGEIVSNSSTYTLTVGEKNMSLSAVYAECQGADLKGAGNTLAENSFAMTDHDISSNVVVDLTASELETLFSIGCQSGRTYRVTDGNAVRITASFNGNGAAIIAPSGLVFNSVNNVSVSDLVVLAPVSIENSANVNLTRVDIQVSGSNAVTLDSASNNVKFDNCKIESDMTAISSSASNLSILNSAVSGNTAIDVNGNGSTVYNCSITAASIGVKVAAEDTAVNNNTITGTASGIEVSGGSINTLVTYNSVSGAEKSINVGDALNTSVLFNGVYSIAAEGSTNTYVVENALNGKLILTNNNYLLCDENSYGDNGRDHNPAMSGNQNFNGNSITDVNARSEVGANEDILPHTNKDLFLDMTPKSSVKDAVGGTSYSVGNYIYYNAKTQDVVIVPPGYYTEEIYHTFTSAHSGAKIYAYGVYLERQFETDPYLKNSNGEYELDENGNKKSNSQQNLIFQFGGSENVEIHGITLGYNHQSAGQVHVLEKSRSGSSWSGYTYKLTLVAAAGYLNSFGSLDSSKFAGNFDLVKQGEIHWSSYSYSGLTANSDGTMTMTVSESAYNNIVAGDVLYCRLAGENRSTLFFGKDAGNITLKDCTIYGYAAALAIVGSANFNGATLERVHNTVHSAYIIDQTTYDKYAAWESKYGVELVSIDEKGRYRGTTPIVGSVDATHLNGSNKGFHAISCLFENMCDDGSNHRGSSCRLENYKINSDGTATLYLKANISEYYHNARKTAGKTSETLNPTHFEAGEKIYIYTAGGELVCNTTVLGAIQSSGYSVNDTVDSVAYTLKIYEVKVNASDCNFDVLAGYDLSDNSYAMDQKVLVDNISRNSTGGHYDNVLVQNIRSRGFLVKSNDITIEHCTFRNLAMTSVLMCVEPIWGESTVARNVIVRNTLFDTTGFRSDSFDKDPLLAPIAIQTLTTYGNHATDSLRAENIVIEGNEFRNYGHSYGIYVNGAKDVHILNNVFDPKDSADANQKFVYVVTAADIEISGNQYKNSSGNLTSLTVSGMDDVAYIHGDNVSGSTTSDTDIFINGKHIMYYHVVAENALNQDIADSFASTLSSIDNYTVRSAKSARDYTILLVARDNSSQSLENKDYTVTCNGNTLTITAETKGALAYAVNDFANRLSDITTKTLEITSGESYSYTFEVSGIPATDLTKFKYVGTWQATDANNPTTMVSYWDSAYVEFDFTGTSATLLFSSPSTCNVSIDGGRAKTYNVQDELTISATTAGTHTVRVHYGDKSAHIYFAGVRVPDGQTVSRTADKAMYIQFVGDSISDAGTSFTHRVGDILGWDYSVIACEALSLQADKGYWRYNNGFSNDTGYAAGSMAQLLNQNFGTVSIGMEDAFFKLGIPNKTFPAAGSDEFNDIAANYFTEKYDYNFGTYYTPDIVFIFLGTNDLSASSSQTDINNFVATYKEFVANILAVYGSNTKICAMQAVSTSDSSNLYDTSNPRYVAIAQAASELESLYGDKFNFIDAATVQSWGVQISSDATHPTESGYDTLTTQISKYLFTNYVDQNYVNHSFDISAIRKYEGGWKGVDSTGTDNGISYSHFSFSSNGHINISGKNDNSWSLSNMTNYQENRAVKINGSTGQYLVLMYRASASHHFTLELRTTSSSDKSSDGNDGRLSSVVKPQALVSTDWEIAVVDLSQFANYQCNTSNLRVQVRITTTMSSFDIAYAGLVDNLEEASWIAQFKLNSGKMVVYEDFTAKGEDVYFSEEAEYADKLSKLDFVNNYYDINSITGFLNDGGTFIQGNNYQVSKGNRENGISFSSLSFTGSSGNGYGHAFISGSNVLSPINGSTGNYLVIQYRTSGGSNLNLEVRTGTSEESNAVEKLSAVNKPKENVVANTWEMAVIDLSQFANYQRGANGLYVQIRISTGMAKLDIAHVAIVDSIDEAESFISVASSNTEYVLYTDWAGTGTKCTID